MNPLSPVIHVNRKPSRMYYYAQNNNGMPQERGNRKLQQPPGSPPRMCPIPFCKHGTGAHMLGDLLDGS